MKNVRRLLPLAVVMSATVFGAAFADSGKPRLQVQAELAAAQRAGDVRIALAGLSPRELFPGDYPMVDTGPGKTREQVMTELAAAQRAGDVRIALAGLSPRELFPGDYRRAESPQGLARLKELVPVH